MSAGCLNPNAVNYNGASTSEDYSCKYLMKYDGTCHLFEDVLPADIEDKSFTLSFSVAGQNWVFFHDYIPDYYMHTRDSLYNFKQNKVYKHHEGQAGQYFSGTKSFFIDIIFRGESDMLLESVQWVTEYLSSNTDNPFNSLSHISIWNSVQHTGRIALSEIWNLLEYNNIRRTKGEWSFNDFRDALKVDASTFLGTIFNNYAVDGTKLETSPVWYEQSHMQDSWFCIRFEFDNTADAKVVIHDVSVQALKTDR